MKIRPLLVAAAALTGLAATLQAATISYQVTGPVIEVTEAKVVVQKDKEKWEIARTADTKITGDLKVGSKITVIYTMTASSVEVKPEKPEKQDAPSAPETTPAKAVKRAAPAKPASAPAKLEKKP
jgi:hypothetical protein